MAERPELGEVLEFLQAVLAGGVVLDRADPYHQAVLEEACRALDEFRAVAHLVPELSQSGEGLAGVQESVLAGSQALLTKIGLLENLYHALDDHLVGLRRRAQRAPEPGVGPAAPVAQDYAGVVAVDVGTSNLALACWAMGEAAPQGVALEPAAVNVLDAAGFQRLAPDSYLTGEPALAHKSAINLYRSFRRLLGGQGSPRPAATGRDLVAVQPGDLVAAQVQSLLAGLRQRLGQPGLRFPQLVATVPASGDLALEYELRRVFEGLGLRVETALDEATAACVSSLLRPVLLQEHLRAGSEGRPATPGEWFVRRLGLTHEPGARADALAFTLHVLCVDVGGGSTDLSLLELSLQQDAGGCQVQLEVQGTTGFPQLSGEGLTLHLFQLLKRRLALALLHPRRALAGQQEDPGAEPHPWLEWHRREAGGPDPGLEARLAEDRRLLLTHWDEVAGAAPLRDALAAAVDRLLPTVTRGAPPAGRKARGALFRWLWLEAERLKRRIAAERAELDVLQRDPDDPLPTVRGRLDPGACPALPGGPELSQRLARAGVDLGRPPRPDALAVSSRDVDAWVDAQGGALLEAAIRRLLGEARLDHVVLAGGGTHAARQAIERLLQTRFGLGRARVSFDPETAKRGVAEGACLWAFANRLEGIEVLLSRQPRCPARLWLLSAVGQEVLFEEGQHLQRFSYVQPPYREGDQGDKLVLIGREVGGRFEPFLMFDPRQGEDLPEVGDLEVLQRRDLLVRNVDRFLAFTVQGTRTEFHVRDPGHYLQVEGAMVPQWEMLEALRREMRAEEVIAWLESSEHLQLAPPPGCAFHRYYLDEDRQLYLVFHAQGRKRLCRAQVTRQGRHHLPEELDPFSGVH